MKTTAEKIAVMQAFLDGKPIECRRIGVGRVWGPIHYDTAIGPVWDWAEVDYRVKPEPREWMLVESVDYPGAFMVASTNLNLFGIRAREVIE